MNAASVANMRMLPPPALKSVPDAQPPPSCMPTPKRKAPTMTGTPAGATEPRTTWPRTDPCAIRGTKTEVVTASISICARRPPLRPCAIISRHDEVNPNAAW